MSSVFLVSLIQWRLDRDLTDPNCATLPLLLLWLMSRSRLWKLITTSVLATILTLSMAAVSANLASNKFTPHGATTTALPKSPNDEVTSPPDHPRTTPHLRNRRAPREVTDNFHCPYIQFFESLISAIR